MKKHILIRARDSKDPELYQEDLDLYFGCFDYVCGVRSTSDMTHLFNSSPSNSIASKHIEDANDAHPDDASSQAMTVKAAKNGLADAGRQEDALINNLASIARARRVWRRLVSLPWLTQEFLRRVYTPVRELPDVTEAQLRAAHREYLQ